MNSAMSPRNIVIIGSSAGGPRILKEIFNGLPRLAGAIVLVQHMPKFINETLSKSLDDICDMTVRVAQFGEQLRSGIVYVAPSELHLELVDNRRIRMFTGSKVNFVCPAVDVTMRSVKKESSTLR